MKHLILLLVILWLSAGNVLSQDDLCCGDLGLVITPACPLQCNGSATVVTNLPSDYSVTWYNSAGAIIGIGWSIDSLCADSTYLVVVFNIPFNCYDTAWVHIDPGCCIITDYSVQGDDCKPAPTGSVVVSSSEGTPPYTISWSDAGSGFVRNHLYAGTYLATITDAVGCIDVIWVDIPSVTGPSVEIISPDVGCGEVVASVVAKVTGGYGSITYQWSSGHTDSIATGLVGGIYTVTVTDAQGCTDSTMVIITVPSDPILSVVPLATDCGVANGMLTITSSGVDSIQVSGSNGFSYVGIGPVLSIGGLSPGVYTVTAYNIYGCSTTVSSVVMNSDAPDNTIECVLLCEPDSVAGVWITGDTSIILPMVSLDSCPYVKIIQIHLLSSDTMYTSIEACFGQVITVNGTMLDSSGVLVQEIGDCGYAIVDVSFSPEPDTVIGSLSRICGDSSQVFDSWSVVAKDTLSGCPTRLALNRIEIEPFVEIIKVVDTLYGCGLVPDTLFTLIGSHRDSCEYVVYVRKHITRMVDYLYFEEQICNPSDSVYWDKTGEWHYAGVSSFYDSLRCEYSVLDVNIVPKPVDSVVVGYTCIPDSVGIKYIMGEDCQPNIIQVVLLTEPVKEDTIVEICIPNMPSRVDTIPLQGGCYSIMTTRFEWVPDFYDQVIIDLCRHPGSGTHIRDTIVGEGGCYGIVDTFWLYSPVVAVEFEPTCDVAMVGTLKDSVVVTGGVCDTLVLRYWSYDEQDKFSQVVQMCQGESYSFYGNDLVLPGVYVHLIPNQSGCVDTVELTLVVLPVVELTDIRLVCAGDSVMWNGLYFTAGSYTDYFQGVWGCDSIVTLRVVEIPNIEALGGFGSDTVVWRLPEGSDIDSMFATLELQHEHYFDFVLSDSLGIDTLLSVDDDVIWIDDSTRLYHIAYSTSDRSLMCATGDIYQVWRIARTPNWFDSDSDTCVIFVAANPVTHNIQSFVHIQGVSRSVSLELQDLTGHTLWRWSSLSIGNIDTKVPLPMNLPSSLYWLLINVPELDDGYREWAIQVLYH